MRRQEETRRKILSTMNPITGRFFWTYLGVLKFFMCHGKTQNGFKFFRISSHTPKKDQEGSAEIICKDIDILSHPRVTWLAIVGYLILKIRLTHEIFSKVFVCFTAEIYSKVFICHCWVAVKFLFVSKLWPARLYSVSQFTDWSLHHELVRRPILRRLYYLKKQGCIFFKLDSTRTIFRGTPKSRYSLVFHCCAVSPPQLVPPSRKYVLRK